MSANLPRATYTDNPADMAPLHKHLDNVLDDLDESYLGKKFGHFIDGDFVAGENHYEVFSPADSNRLMGSFADAGIGDVDKAVAAARAAYQQWLPSHGKIASRQCAK
jgi:NAD-dependent aldehyde dehydrogenases